MFGEGGKIGPELPGSFEDMDYLLQNILDPNAIIGKDYQQTFVTLKDGRLVAGVIAAEDPGSVTLKTLAEPVTVQRADIAKMNVERTVDDARGAARRARRTGRARSFRSTSARSSRCRCRARRKRHRGG